MRKIQESKFKRFIVSSFLVSCLLIFGFSIPHVFAQSLGVEDSFGGSTSTGFADAAGLAYSDSLPIVIAKLIRVVIGFLGIIAVIIILIGGFKFMTAAGADDKVKSAKKLMTNGVIGLVIILSSFAIASFIISSLVTATGGITTTDDPGDPGGDYCDGGCGGTTDEFLLTDVNTDCAYAIKNLQLQMTFSGRVSEDSVTAGGITVTQEGTVVDGTFDVDLNSVTFTPSALCYDAEGVLIDGENCFEAEMEYVLALDDTILEDTSGNELDCSFTDNPCEFTFTTGTDVDTEGPTITMASPEEDDQVFKNDIETLQTLAEDDTGVSNVDFAVDGDTVFQAGLSTNSMEGSLAILNYFYSGSYDSASDTLYDVLDWDTLTYTTGYYSLSAEGSDCAGHSASDTVNIVLRAEHCNNSERDEDEEGLNCGGADCGACDGDSCSSDLDCAGGYCADIDPETGLGQCATVPEISEVSPGDGAPGNLITIVGEGFGESSTPGTVTFLGDESIETDDVEVTIYECNGVTSWGDDEIVIQLDDSTPDDSPIRVTTFEAYYDQTNDDDGPTISDFNINNVERPGICLLDPSASVGGNEDTSISGLNFGADQGTSTVYFGNYEPSEYNSGGWSNELLSVLIPLLDAGTYSTQVFAGDYVCATGAGVSTGVVCSSDGDCDETAGESCETNQCEDSGDYCEDDSECDTTTDEDCVSLRQGSNARTLTVTDPSTGETPIISQVDTGWELCSDTGLHCGDDADCGDFDLTTDDEQCEEADPTMGPSGQYVTIYGSNFGTTIGTITFTSDDGFGYALGVLDDFPDACGDDLWNDTEITLKVPSVLQVSGSTVTAGSYTLVVTAGGVDSDGVDFEIVADSPGPGICDIDPSGGPVEDSSGDPTSITISGDNFDDVGSSSVVVFYNAQETDLDTFNTTTWTNQSIVVDVDPDTESGPVKATSDVGYDSNSMNFEVGDCNDGTITCDAASEVCCASGVCSSSCDTVYGDAHYAWRFSTGNIPDAPSVRVYCGDEDGDGDYDGVTPGPWENWSEPSDICVNTSVTATFDMDMIDLDSTSTLDDSGAVTVYSCVGTDSTDPCATLTAVDGVVTAVSAYRFSWRPTSGGSTIDFQPDTTYRVVLASSVIRASDDPSVGGEYMENDYTWDFTTANSTDHCSVGSIDVDPSEYTMTEEGDTEPYSGLAIAENDECVPLDCTAYTWDWDSDELYASVDSTGSSTSCITNVTAIAETSGTDIEATLTAEEGQPSDSGELIINYTDPEVTNYEPSCDTACLNALVLATFNTDMENGDFTTSTVSMYECYDSLCDPDDSGTTAYALTDSNLDFNDTTDGASEATLEIIGLSDFTANTWYRVVISGSVRSESGVELSDSGSNYPSDANRYFEEAFSWTFKTKDSAEACAVDHITMNPETSTATIVGEQDLWEALPYGAPDDCSATGQALDPTDYPWDAWSACDDDNDPACTGVGGEYGDVAMMSPVTGILELSSDLEVGCSSECLHTGATLNTDTAVCGNGGTPEYGEECEVGDTGCSAECLNEGSSASYSTPSVCGDGSVGIGEECDEAGDTSDDDGCSAECLNEGSRSISSMCGDGIIDQSASTGGEDCDDDNTTNGDGCSSNCLNEGGELIADVDATCGDGVLGDGDSTNGTEGEDCDEGDAVDGDGCSSDCLYEGASACAYECVGGDDDGENCSGIDVATCTDDSFPYAEDGECLPVNVPCCGDGALTYSTADRAEDCEDGDTDDGDGCSSECLYEGSSVDYDSYCGDGDQETNEECEAVSGAINNMFNWGVSVVNATAALDVVDGFAISNITAEESDSDAQGVGVLSLECSCTDDASCSVGGADTTLGCGTSSCCFTRPTEDDLYPAEDAEDVCLNTAIYVEFSQEMDESTFIATFDEDEDGTIDADELGNIHLQLVQVTGSSGLEDVTAATCSAAGYEQVAFADTPPSTWIGRAWNWIWQSVRSLFGSSATAVTTTTTTCLVPVDFSTSQTATGGMRVSVVLSDLLEVDAKYRLVITEDGPMSDAGVLSVNTVGVYPSVTNSFFTTGDEVCTLDEVVVEDLGEENALADTSGVLDESIGYFTDSGEIHSVTATSYTVRGGDLEEITPVTGYSWTWSWASPYDSVTESNVLTAALSSTSSATSPSEASATSTEVSGSETITATADVTSSIEDITASDVSGQLSMTSNICDNPWPPRDTTDSYTLPYSDSTSNFGFYYCRDAGDSGIADDLPELDAPIDVTTPYTTEIIQELIFKVNGEADAIGVRVLSNGSTATDAVSYLSAADWYTAQEFTGSPSDTTLDGYEAVEDGNTTYVAAANYNGTSIYPNIYAISYTEDASDESQEIFDQILANWTFNANNTVVTDVNLCIEGSAYPVGSGDELISCTWDGDCVETCTEGVCPVSGITVGGNTACTATDPCLLAVESCEIASGETTGVCSISGAACTSTAGCTATSGTPTCDAEKAKLTRDMKRLTDLQHMTALLTTYGEENGYCSVTTDQTCTEDTECPGDETCEPAVPTVSEGTFVRSIATSAWSSWASVLGNDLGEALPEDPLNEFYECDASGYESDTCWNPVDATFTCPDESHVYGYRSIGGIGYQVDAQLEYDSRATWAYPFDPAGTIDDVVIENDYSGTLLSGFGTSTTPMCQGGTAGSSAICGDGILGTSTSGVDEVCEIGDTIYGSMACAGSDGLGDGILCDDKSDCDTSVPETCVAIACETGSGTITTTCESDCSGYQTVTEAEGTSGTSGTDCTPFECGNGVVDGSTEECDDGSANGTYGHCGDDCTTDSAFSCGDGYLAGGEECDCGETDNFDALTDDGTSGDAYDISSWAYIFSASSGACEVSNGQYNAAASGSCSWDCQSPGPSCGDGAVNGSEECDGDYETWDGALCADNSMSTATDAGEACTTDDDCDSEVCGSDTDDDYQACSASRVCEDTSAGTATDVGKMCDDNADCVGDCSPFTYSTIRSRTCLMDSSSSACTFGSTSYPGGWSVCASITEYCGNGTVDGDEECDDGNDEDTDACTTSCLENVCGDDSVYSGVESCDNGADNGDTCNATYQGTCNYCTTNCQYMTSSGEYCGDGVINGNEFCDGSDIPMYYIDFSGADSATEDGVYTKGSTCDTYSEEMGGTTDGLTYNCYVLGVCDGGTKQGQVCTGSLTGAHTSTSYASDANDCNDGTCVMPTCADDCNTMCPLSFETSSVLAMGEEVGASAEDSISLYSYLEDTTQDNAVLFIPACSVATSITADIDDSEVDPPSVAIMFVTDYTQTMERFPDGLMYCDTDGDGYGDSDGEECTDDVDDGVDVDYEDGDACPTTTGKLCQEEAPEGESRIDIISSATGEGISDLFSSLESVQAGLMRIYSGSPGYVVDSVLGESESNLLSELDAYSTDDNLESGPPAYPGLKQAVSLVAATDANLQIVVLLSDGEVTQDKDLASCAATAGSGEICDVITDSGTTNNSGATVSSCSEPDRSDCSGYTSCAREISLGLLEDSCGFEDNVDDALRDSGTVKIFTAAITSSDSRIANMAHMSSMACGQLYWDEDDCPVGDDGVIYAYDATTEEGIREMYSNIIDSILGVNFALTTESSDGSADVTSGSSPIGRDQELPFPDGFACSDEETEVPFTVTFNGTGAVTLSDITVTYCPAL